MNFKITFLALLVFAFTSNTFSSEISITPDNKKTEEQSAKIPESHKPVKTHWNPLTTMLIGGSIGAATGYIDFVFDHDDLFPWNWLLSCVARSIIFHGIESQAKTHDENLNSSLLHASGWAGSWVSYLMLYSAHKNPQYFQNVIARKIKNFLDRHK